MLFEICALLIELFSTKSNRLASFAVATLSRQQQNALTHARALCCSLSLFSCFALSSHSSLASRLRSATRRKPVALVVVSYASHLTPRRSFGTPSSQSPSQRLIEKCFVCEKLWQELSCFYQVKLNKTRDKERTSG